MELFQARKVNSKPGDTEGTKIRQLAYTMLVDVPFTQWKVIEASSSKRSNVLPFERVTIITVLENGKQIKIVRCECRKSAGSKTSKNSRLPYYRRYEFFIERILMGHEDYQDEQEQLEYLGSIFEKVYTSLGSSLRRSEQID